MLNRRVIKFLIAAQLVNGLLCTNTFAEPEQHLKPGTRCPVCGMFVAKYTSWISQIILSDGSYQAFDGVKDMLAYYFNPNKYGSPTQNFIKEVWVKDYYSLGWIDGRKAFYVVGSNIYGPMGNELIPFISKDAAASFMKDHKGKQIFSFSEIDKTLVESIRADSKMKQ